MIVRRFRAVGVNLLLLATLLLGAAVHAGAQATPAGFWQTVSDVDSKPTAIIELRLVGDRYVGTIRKLLTQPENTTCDDCPGDRKGQRVVGMEILRGMRADGAAWSGGEILDPESGKTYRASMRLDDGGRKLIVRGFIGISLFGRSQTWLRADSTMGS